MPTNKESAIFDGLGNAQYPILTFPNDLNLFKSLLEHISGFREPITFVVLKLCL